jgi:diguanylate cyclase (GGDEF)-like protein
MISANLTREELARRLRVSEKKMRLLQKLVYEDALTGLGNRRYFDAAFGDELALAERQGIKLSVFVIDVNGLKRINDTKGHKFGDRLIRKTANAIKATVRRGDLAFRYGGDEFVILAFTKGRTGAGSLRRRLAGAMESRGISAAIGSAGIWEASGSSAARRLFRLADKRMYDRKLKMKKGAA